MGTDNLHKKRHEKLEARKAESRNPKPNSFLIVSEGEKTEPLYFDGLASYINKKFGDSIDVQKPIIETCGEGKCTVSLVKAAERIVSRSKIVYSQIWVVFDKDDFKDFDDAIELAEKMGYNVAWSNQSFEYWIYLHFNYSDSALHRDGWVEKLSEIFKQRKICSDGYKKNDPNVFSLATTHGSLRLAMKYSNKIESTYNDGQKPSKCDPCTMVHHLVEQLTPYLEELL